MISERVIDEEVLKEMIDAKLDQNKILENAKIVTKISSFMMQEKMSCNLSDIFLARGDVCNQESVFRVRAFMVGF